MKLSHKQKITALMLDGRWHSNFELNRRICIRYTARIGELKEDGFKFEKRQISQQQFEWRLLTPKEHIDPVTFKLLPIEKRKPQQTLF